MIRLPSNWLRFPLLISMRWHRSALIPVGLALVASLCTAQPAPITLTVALRTTTDQPVAQVAVAVIDAASTVRLCQDVTDRNGQAHFAGIAPVDVRIQLVGTLPDGVKLRPTPQDQDGIWVSLPGRDWTMQLRVDTDGLVFPDLHADGAGAPDAQDGGDPLASAPLAPRPLSIAPNAVHVDADQPPPTPVRATALAAPSQSAAYAAATTSDDPADDGLATTVAATLLLLALGTMLIVVLRIAARTRL